MRFESLWSTLRRTMLPYFLYPQPGAIFHTLHSFMKYCTISIAKKKKKYSAVSGTKTSSEFRIKDLREMRLQDFLNSSTTLLWLYLINEMVTTFVRYVFCIICLQLPFSFCFILLMISHVAFNLMSIYIRKYV